MRRPWIVVTGSLFVTAAVLAVGLAGTAAGATGAANGPGAPERLTSLPAGFRAQAVTWASPMLGWVLGVAPCGDTTCTTILATTNGGGTWNQKGTMRAPLTSEERAGVTELRFADATHGWAFAPNLWSTDDGGAKWHRESIPGGGRQVQALAGDADGVFALVSSCRMHEPPSNCKPATLWRTTPGGDSWTQMSLSLAKGLVTVLAVLKVHDATAYLAIPNEAEPDVLEATTDGTDWSSRPEPCRKANDEQLVDVAPITDTKVAMLCVGDAGTGMSRKRVLRSSDTGMTTTPAGTMPAEGIVSQIAAAPNGTLVVSSWSAPGSWIYRNTGGRQWATSVSLFDDGVGWNDISFATNSIGFVVYGPAAVFPGNRPGQLWATPDGGATWSPV
jgi:photosystem II stability/assembly factor-like uncharacterized protein